ncbi:MAG: RNA methyltransferase [Microscillaceae bacterium]|nr:RNA methyltransferase [Microscillaceae bacterium]
MRKTPNEALPRVSVAEFKNLSKHPVVLVLDNLRSMHNVGAAFRTADAFAIEKIYLCGITAQPPHREIHKAALGATESVAWQYHENTAGLLAQLAEEGWLAVAIEQAEGSIMLQAFPFKAGQKYALVFGNEVSGVSEEVMGQVQTALEIPQFGTKHSLNVSVSIGVVLWEYCRQVVL